MSSGSGARKVGPVCDRLIAIAGKYLRVNSSLDMNAEKCLELFASGSSRRLKQSGLSTTKKERPGSGSFQVSLLSAEPHLPAPTPDPKHVKRYTRTCAGFQSACAAVNPSTVARESFVRIT